MRYVILGAGAVGGALGGRLADAGHDVVLLARGEHAAALRRNGLTLETPDATLHVRPAVADSPDELRLHADDVLVLTVKSQQTQALLDGVVGLPVTGLPAAGGIAGDALPLICAQNGVSNELAALRTFARVYGTCVMCPAEHLEPGLVIAAGAPYTGCFDTGRYPDGTDEVVRHFVTDVSASACIATARDDIMAWKYAKLLRNLANAVNALLGDDLDRAAQQVADDIVARADAEARRCLQASGISTVSDADWADYRFDKIAVHPVAGRPRGGSSTWQSITRGTGNVEADFLNGEIVLLGRLHGLATPVNLGLQRAVNALAARGGSPGELTADQLADAVAGRG